MEENLIPVMTDESVIPTDDYIFSFIGEKKVLWQNLFEQLSSGYEDMEGSWRFYNDGKRWLFKMVYKKKTIFWLGVFSGAFRITFYFGDKAQSHIDAADIPEAVNESFRSAKKYGAIRPVSFIMNNVEDIGNVLKMIEIKKKMK